MRIFRVWPALFSLILGVLFEPVAHAALVTVNFTGTVIESTGQPGVFLGDALVGSYSYDPTVVNVGTASSSLYPQPANAHIEISVGTLSLSAPLTSVSLENENFQGYNRYLASYDESFGSNGEIQLSVYLYTPNPTAPISTTLTPTPPDFNSFTDAYIDYVVYDDVPDVTTFVRADITSLAAVPEPQTLLMFGLAAAACIVARRRSLGDT